MINLSKINANTLGYTDGIWKGVGLLILNKDMNKLTKKCVEPNIM